MIILEPPSAELEIVIRQEVKEDLDTRDGYLQALKDWLLQQPHLPDTLDNVLLLNFLRGCNFSLEKCKNKLDSYFTMRTVSPDIFTKRTFENLELLKISKSVTFPPLPYLTKEGRRVSVVRINDKNSTGRVEEAIKIILMLYDVRLLMEKAGVAGEVHIMDASTVSANHFALLTPTSVKTLVVNLFEIYPIKVKEIHVINCHPFVNVIYSWVKPFLKKKIRDRMHFHSDGMESLYNFVPKEILPEEYGGNVGTLQDLHDSWMQKLVEYEPWFTEQENMKSDESKRPVKLINYDELFGVEGSFKQLSID